MKKIKSEYYLVILAGILCGIIVFGGQIFANHGLSLLEISILPFGISALLLLPFVIFNKTLQLPKKLFGLMSLYGIVSAMTIIGQYGALFFNIPVAIVVLLLYSQPLWTIIICRFFLKEKISTQDVIACIIVLLGVFFLVNPLNSAGSYNLIGILLALLGGLSLSGWIIIGTLLSQRKNHPIGSQFFGMGFAVLILGVLALFLKSTNIDQSLLIFRLDFSWKIWITIILYSIFAVTFSQIAYLYAVKKISAINAGIIMLLEPVSATILSLIFLKQPITLSIFIGGALILLANYLIITKKEN